MVACHCGCISVCLWIDNERENSTGEKGVCTCTLSPVFYGQFHNECTKQESRDAHGCSATSHFTTKTLSLLSGVDYKPLIMYFLF